MAEGRRIRSWVLIPPLAALGLAGLFLAGLMRDNPDELPSMLAARPAPALALTPLRPGEAPPGPADLTAPGVKLVNFWASWCAPCRVEHPMLVEIAARGIPVIGVNYKDDPDKALAFLRELGDPFTRLGADPTGRNGIEWGIYGVPETFVIDGNGTVLLRHPGPITREVFRNRIAPLLQGG
ncbi:MAG: thiol:disulfide interchange protein [Paracoccaceae bacterium]|nr:MAG: thiol:disulfide interchange protein [Paracoccaceae bacterium]